MDGPSDGILDGPTLFVGRSAAPLGSEGVIDGMSDGMSEGATVNIPGVAMPGADGETGASVGETGASVGSSWVGFSLPEGSPLGSAEGTTAEGIAVGPTEGAADPVGTVVGIAEGLMLPVGTRLGS